MEKYLKSLLILCLSVSFTACGSDDDATEIPAPEYDLKLSIDHNKIHWIKDIDFDFDILSGNGSYTAVIADEDIARVSVEDSIVHINFIRNGYTKLTVTDVTGRSIELSFSVYNPTLVSSNYTVFMEKGQVTSIGDLSFFGSGTGYKVDNMKGGSVMLVISETELVIAANNFGNTYCDIVDSRGTKMPLTVIVVAIHELTSNVLNITMNSDQRASIKCLWGKGWKITSESPFCKSVILTSQKADGYDILQLDSAPDMFGSGTILLMDKDGNIAQVNITIN
jgi:hypothetical protein